MKSDDSSNGPEVEFPKKYFFSTEIPIRKIDLSLDIHVSFASVLDLVMEAHLQFFQFLGYSVTDIHGNSIIFANAVILYQGELLFKDRVVIDVSLDNIGEKSFDLYFRLSKDRRRQKVSLVKIRVLFFNYEQRKVVPIPSAFRDKFETGKVPARVSPDVGEGSIIAKGADSYGGEIGFRKLEVWKLSHEFVLRLFNLCDIWKPQAEATLIEHIRSVASLLPVRIAGAWGARIRSEKIRNILRAKVHLEELRYLLILVSDLGVADPKKELADLVKINSHLKKYLNRVRTGEARKIR
ncbi:four helix bundle protein [Leptospira broomii serovar Hurstbridge str. 5399]|uniref:Four helix bundle protein n=1 Tax=Leptospira broomii serovar Hurstbridge str. 5399 TaxID=1049789 RepID=T0GFI9_9LEPT|nr:four helix bundle protein [Leptospira broomii]EQA45574.1 four helix bundle protein [Leptospira broomii serovar Hurstbridge str. 5399]